MKLRYAAQTLNFSIGNALKIKKKYIIYLKNTDSIV